jgi:serine/threonine protein kinase
MSGFGGQSSIHHSKYETEEAVPYERDKDTWDVEGGSGAVYRYTERNGGEPVAVKRIRYKGVNSAEKRARWKDTVEREISLLKICNHRNIAKFVAAYLIVAWKLSVISAI